MAVYNNKMSVPPDDVDAVHGFLQSIWDDNPQIPSRDRFGFETALIELASNIFLYSVATAGINCEIIVETSLDRIVAIVSDNGELAELVLDEHVMPEEFSESGRGIALIRALVDEFDYSVSEKKNTWRISKGIKT